MVETIERKEMEVKIVGFAYFPLFLAPDGTSSPFNSDVDQFIINEGAYQIPIYYERISSEDELHIRAFQELPKINCATLLVRAYPCARNKQK